jgi:hypothetical protein
LSSHTTCTVSPDRARVANLFSLELLLIIMVVQ